MPDSRKLCIDEFHNVHYLSKMLASGGQGIVYRTRDPDVAVKLLAAGASDKEKFRRLRFLPIPPEANITFPAALLRGKAGYVMTLLSDLDPAGCLIINPKNAGHITKEQIPEWLSAVPDIEMAKQITAYRDTGGLRRRLLVLHKIASQLAVIHGAGLVYDDISHNNIFISGDAGECVTAWFIDADNLKYEGEKGRHFTRGYGAPEIVQATGFATQASDCHAFAVLAYKMLTMAHPFLGEKAESGDFADEGEANAYAGHYPWVDDEDDDSNRSDGNRLPPKLLFNGELTALFQKTFGKGRTNPAARPPVFHWPEAFANAADAAIQCPGCGMSYYDEDGVEQCPYHCGTPKPALLVLESFVRENGAVGERRSRFVRELRKPCEIQIPARIFSPVPLMKSDIPALEIGIREDSVNFKKLEAQSIEFSVAAKHIDQGKFKKLLSQIKFQQNQNEYFIYAESPGSSRMLRCGLKGGA